MPAASTSPLPGLPGYLDYNAGWTTQALGTAAARQWLAGYIPWWDSFSGVGLPLAAEMQSSALFLPYILLLLLPGGTVLLMLSLQWTAGFATWRLLLRLHLSSLAAVTGALLFELCASFAWVGPPAALPVAFLPLFLLGVERARIAASTGRAGWRTTAVAVALSLYAGFPETAYLDGLLALLWAVVRGASLPGYRLRYLMRVVAGGVIGLLLAAPVLWPFLDLLRFADLGSRRTVDMTPLAMPQEGLAQWLTPYALGLPAGLSNLDASGRLLTIWGRAGGYLGMGLALAALLGALAPGPKRVLRVVLLAWVTLLLGRVAGVPGLREWFGIVPFAQQMQVFRYSGAAWFLPCCILAAFAIDQRRSAVRVWSCAGFLVLAELLTVGWAWPLAEGIPTAPTYLASSAAWGLLTVTAVALACSRRPGAMACALVADAALLFIVPDAAGVPHPAIDRASIDFLQRHLGLQRFATLGPIQPNFGGVFGLASANSNYLPSPSMWSDYIAAHLRPGGDPVLFNGVFPADRAGQPTNAGIMQQHFPEYAAIGVRYVVTAPGPDPFAPPSATWDGPVTHVRLETGAEVSGRLAMGDRPIVGLNVTIGTFAGVADGVLAAELCGTNDCATGEANLTGAADNEPLLIRLAHPVPGASGWNWTLRHSGTQPVAIWGVGDGDGVRLKVAPVYAPTLYEPALAFTGASMSIYELADAAPYWSTEGGPCRLHPEGRMVVEAECDGPALLVRRELAMPGWQAAVNGSMVTPSTVESLFQAVQLARGRSTIAFSYFPPGLRCFVTLFVAGVVGLLPWSLTRTGLSKLRMNR